MKKLASIEILGINFEITWDPTTNGASFDMFTQKILIGTQSPEDWQWNLVSHEISEIIHCQLCTRYSDYSVGGNYRFSMDHKQFETHNMILISVLRKFMS